MAKQMSKRPAAAAAFQRLRRTGMAVGQQVGTAPQKPVKRAKHGAKRNRGESR
jgi:hypothetical protein